VVRDAGGDLLPFVLRQVADDEAADLLLQVGEVAPEDALPELHRAVGAGEDECVPVGAEGDAVNGGPGAADGELCVAVRVPEPDGSVVAGGGERLAVGAEGNAVDRAAVTGQDGELPVAAGVPEPHRSGVPAGGERVPVQAEGDGDRA